MRTLEIIIVVVVLVVLAALVGCKDEPEVSLEEVYASYDADNASNPGGIEITADPDDATFTINESEVTLEVDPNYITFDWEPDYPISFSFCSGIHLRRVNFEIGEENEIVCDGTREKWLRITYEALSGKEPTGEVILRFEEPNEPESALNWIDAVGRWPDAQGYVTDNFGNTTPMSTFTEPDEPEDD